MQISLFHNSGSTCFNNNRLHQIFEKDLKQGAWNSNNLLLLQKPLSFLPQRKPECQISPERLKWGMASKTRVCKSTKFNNLSPFPVDRLFPPWCFYNIIFLSMIGHTAVTSRCLRGTQVSPNFRNNRPCASILQIFMFFENKF